MKERIDKLDFVKVEKFCSAKDISEKGLYPKYRVLLTQHKKMSKLIETQAKI